MRQPAFGLWRCSKPPIGRFAPAVNGFDCEDSVNLERVLITGGAGLVGSHLADALVAAGACEIVILDDFSRGRRENLTHAASSGRLRVITGDVRDPGDVSRAIAGA